ncbi:hypothetical protein IAR50_007294 [Cryptococcus sp. DSM 104548]
MLDIIYAEDRRYPGPTISTPKAGEVMAQEEFDALRPLYTWGELKEIAQAGRLEKFGRNGKVQSRYWFWKAQVLREHGTLENYLKINNLPWGEDDDSEVIQKQEKTVSVEGVLVAPLLGYKEDHYSFENAMPPYLQWESMKHGKNKTWAVLRNQMPYSVPHDVRHFVVWVRVPIYHPELIQHDDAKWQKIKEEGLGGFTGVIPPIDNCEDFKAPAGDPDNIRSFYYTLSTIPGGWYHHDQSKGSAEVQKWYGVQYEAEGGHEVASMVRDLWDERGWECVWFANPAKIRSIPGLAHFHVLARRKTPDEIDASEAIWGV